MKIKTIGELKKYIDNLPDDMKIQHQWDYMYPEIERGVFYF